MDQTWKKQPYCSVDSALVALRDMKIRPQFGAFALTSLTMCEKGLAATVITLAGKTAFWLDYCSSHFNDSIKVINACKTIEKLVFGAGLQLRGCFFHIILFNLIISLNLEICKLEPGNRSTRMADVQLYCCRFIRRSDTQPPNELKERVRRCNTRCPRLHS